MKAKLRGYIWNVIISLDQLANTITAGYPDETFSARSYRKAAARQWFWILVAFAIDNVFFWQKNHCRKSYEIERKRGHSPNAHRSQQ